MKKDGRSRGGKAVIITVYVAKPRRRVSSNSNIHRQRYWQNQGRTEHNMTTGHSRRSELLLYSQKLRALAGSDKAPAAHSVIPAPCKTKFKRSLTGLRNWEMLLLPGFVLRSLASYRGRKEKKKLRRYIGDKMDAIAKSLRVGKRPEFLKRLISKFRK